LLIVPWPSGSIVACRRAQQLAQSVRQSLSRASVRVSWRPSSV